MQLFDPIPPDHAATLEAGLNAHNGATIADRSEFLIGERVEKTGDRLIGGVRATVSRNALFIKHLWVDEAHRGQGLGARLIRAAEEEGKRRGARQACVDTFSNQAPEFYMRLGYNAFGRMDGLGRNGEMFRVWLKKSL